MRLTQYQHSALSAVDDWKSIPEIVVALYPRGSSLRERRAVRAALDKLRDEYLVRFGAANATWKITDKGREVLAASR